MLYIPNAMQNGDFILHMYLHDLWHTNLTLLGMKFKVKILSLLKVSYLVNIHVPSTFDVFGHCFTSAIFLERQYCGSSAYFEFNYLHLTQTYLFGLLPHFKRRC